VKLPGWLLVAALPLVPLSELPLERMAQARSGRPPRIWPADQVRRAAPGFDLLMADLYWLRTVQYFGRRQAFGDDPQLALLYPLIDVTTDLDPRLEMAYRYGAIFLGDRMGANQPDLALKLLRKGADKNPLSWRLRQDLGFYHYLYKADAVTAARILREARQIPGAPFWLETLAASVLRRGGERELARQLWTTLLEQAEAPFMKENAKRHLLNLDALDQQDALQAAVSAYHQQTGRWPASLQDVHAAGLTRVPLTDPSGKPFRYDPQVGRVSIDPWSGAVIN
jgi:hypothetical protein